MFKKNLQNNDGIVLIYSLMILVILSILGIAVVNVAITNLKINKITGELNTAFYIADGAVEEALAQIRNFTHRAEKEASEYINNPDTINRIRSEIELALEGDIIDEEQVEKELEKKLQSEFENRYFGYLLGHEENERPLSGEGLKSDYIEQLETIDFNPDFNNFKEISKGLEVKNSTYYDTPEKRIELVLESDGSYNKYNRRIQIEVNIILPQYEYIISSQTVEKEVHLNEIYHNKAISCEGDLIVTGGQVEIGNKEDNNGNIYCYGTYPDEIRPDTYEMGGIVCGYEKSWLNDFIDNNEHFRYRDISKLGLNGGANLLIHGNAATRANIHTMADNSNIVIDGNAYCDSMLIESNSNNSIINIKKNVIMYDDLEINGFNGKVYVGEEGSLQNGEIWGILDGDPAGLYSDRSSSIIINSFSGNEEVRANRLFIGGAAYIKAYRYVGEDESEENKNYYQTGESVSLGKYSYFYQHKLPFETYADLTEYRDDKNNEYYLIEISKESEEGKISEAQFKTNHFLAYAFENMDDMEGDEDKNRVKIRELSEETLNRNYSLGSIVANNKFFNPEYTMSSEEFLYNEEKGRPEKLDEIDNNTNIFYRRDYGTNKNIDGQFENYYRNISNINSENETDDKENFILIDIKEVELDDGRSIYRDVFINPPDSLDIKSIYGISDDESLEAYCNIINLEPDGSHVVKGIIFTKGNVFIYEEENEEFEFNGAIISKGNVVFYGKGKKKIKYDENKVLSLIAKNDRLYDFFYGDLGRKNTVRNNSIDYYSDNTEHSFDIGVENNDACKKVVVKDKIPGVEGLNKRKEVKTYEIISWKEVD